MDCFQIKNVKNQIFAAICVNIGALQMGCSFAWFGPFSPLLESDETPLKTGPMQPEDIGLAAGLAPTMAPLGLIFAATLGNLFGLRTVLWMNGFLGLICWSILLLTRQVEYIYLMRSLIGVYAGFIIYGNPLIIAEISDENIRGRLGSLLNLALYIGALIIISIGLYLPYKLHPIILLSIGALNVILFYFMPETSQHLLTKGRTKAAEKSIQFYKNCSPNSEKFQKEMEKLSAFVANQETTEKVSFADIFSKEFRKPLAVSLFITSLPSFSGQIALTSFIKSIFLNSGSNLDPKISSIVIVLIQLVGCIFTTSTIDKVGRRFLLIMGCLGAAIGSGMLGIYNYLAISDVDVNVVKWIPLLSVSIVVFADCIGISPISFVIVSEVLPAKIRKVGSLITFFISQVLIALVVLMFPILTERIGLYVCMGVFSLYSFVGVLFSIFVLKDTTGKDLFKIES